MTRKKRAEAWAYLHLGLFGRSDDAESTESNDGRGRDADETAERA
ncbi:hypothetical protein [Haladaptatus caseinilyticus]|nr:hypothetical protein [Haladaptatus caseinilyticus]